MGLRWSEVTNEDVLETYRGRGKNSMNRTAMLLGVSHALVRRVLRGERKDPPVRVEDNRVKCECCHHRPVWTEGGLTRLCRLCWQHKECGEIWPGCGVYVP